MSRRESLWVVVHMARAKSQSDAAREMLTREGFMVRTRIIPQTAGFSEDCYEILALSSEAREARDLLHDEGF